ncbi:phage late control D family protein, partial [Escherichia coli]
MLDALTFDAGSTLTPDYMLMLDSRDITGNISDRLMSMTLTDNRGFEADRVTLTLDDTDGQLQLPPRGARLRVMIGWRGESLVNKGTYV